VIKIADAVPGDEAAIAALCAELEEFYGDRPQGSPAERAGQVRSALFGSPPLAYALVAWDGDAPAGFAAYSFLWPAVGLTASLYLKELYVAGAYRRNKIGSLLMDALEDIARRRRLSRVEWTTDISNPGAQAFYEARGAKILQSKIFYRVAGEDLTGDVN
jgi:ribosomal protein S18 acetylase RimI-like enzyme